MFGFSQDQLLICGTLVFLGLVSIWKWLKPAGGGLPSLKLPYTRGPAVAPGAPPAGVIIDPHDTIEQVGFAHLQGAIHALKQSPRTKPEDLEALAAFAGKIIDLVEPVVPPIAPSTVAVTEVKP